MAAGVGEAQQAEDVAVAVAVEGEEIPAGASMSADFGEESEEDISMEDVLGPGTKKKAATAESPAEEVEHQTL